MNNKLLLIALVILLGVYGLIRLFSGKKEKSFNSELIAVDSLQVTAISIDPKGPELAFTLQPENGNWMATNESLTIKAYPKQVEQLLSALSLIKTKQIVAKTPDKWPSYEVEEGTAHHIMVYEKGKLSEDFYVGKMSFNQQMRTATLYIRLNGADEVYAVDGFQAMSLGQGFDSYRDKTLLNLSPEIEINAFRYEWPDTTWRFEKSATGWTLAGTTQLDSMKVENYLSAFRNFNGTVFADDFDELKAREYPTQTLVLEGKNSPEAFQIQVFIDTARTEPFILRSNYNKDSYFLSDSSGIYQQLFKMPAELMPDQG
ncbi:MAG TPA: DUF4340 domain-containing protein [Saprospiraceae bacterium]|nr:DUF4340 domain-containing protein [Saprospiraceae bacterium]HMQ83345.1 DUF4340 domain-containing protein [Saprospiraceae bacterium]